jgi:hypothetical protein
MPTIRLLVPIIALATLLGGCASGRPYGPDSPYFDYPLNMHIALLRPLEIEPGNATARLQHGRVVARNGVNEYDPYCILELDTVAVAPQQVRPDEFRVTRFQRRIQDHAGMPVAASGRLFALFDDDGGPSQAYYISEFRLRSERQPAVRALTCQSDQNAAGIAIRRHLTLAEMREALGDWFRLDLPR